MMEHIYPGVWKITLGNPELKTPVTLRHYHPAFKHLQTLTTVEAPPIAADDIHWKHTVRGFEVHLPLLAAEQIFGMGLQLRSFNQRGKKKMLRVNSDPCADLGDSHAPVPFYVSTAGYGVYIDSARNVTINAGATQARGELASDSAVSNSIGLSTEELYTDRNAAKCAEVIIEVPAAEGVDLYLFAGPDLRTAVQRYVLFSGGGALPPRWGLGCWYRMRADFNQQQVLDIATQFRAEAIPCDVLGAEPGWQTQAYPCTYLWKDTFPDPAEMMRELAKKGYRLNLWTHAFVDKNSPLYQPLFPYSGDNLVFSGLVPDFTLPVARKLLTDFFSQTHVALGVSGYKLDECDSSDYISSSWSFPETTMFPSGLDGEQYHSLFGLQYQQAIWSIFRQRHMRTYCQVRSSHALAAPYPFVLYSDLYDHHDFMRGIVNSGFCGLLWSPEVRDAKSAEDLLRRLQMVVLSPQALVNAWYIKNAPWKQWETLANNSDQFAENWKEVEGLCRSWLELRMQLIPYLYSAFYRYYLEGIPPFRALVMDYPDDEQTWQIDNEYLIGDSLLAAPVVAGESSRAIYLPVGRWYDFWSGEVFDGGQTITRQVPLEQSPLFVKAGALLPLAQSTLSTADPASYNITVRVYGNGTLPMALYEDNELSYDYENGAWNRLLLSWDGVNESGTITRQGEIDCPQYQIIAWERIE